MRTWIVGLACMALAGCAGAPEPAAPPPTPSPHAREVIGTGTVATILEDFDRGPAELQLNRRVDFWGERVLSGSGNIDVVDAGTGGTGMAARYRFSATFDKPWSIDGWKDSGLILVGSAELDAPGPDAVGVTFRLRPDGFTLVDVNLVQESAGQERAWHLVLSANDGEWRQWRLPFSAFSPAEGGSSLDLNRSARLEIQVPYVENWNAWQFRTASPLQAAFLLDDPGYWRSTTPMEARTLESFDDEPDRMPLTVDLYGTATWTDYTKSDAGETKLNGAIKAQRLRLGKMPDGPEGAFLELKGRLELTPAIAEFHKAGQTITAFLKAPFSAPLSGARAVSFLVRSDIAMEGTVEIQDEENDRYYGAGFTVLGSWSRVRIPFERLIAGDQSLAGAKKITAAPRLQLSFELPPAAVEKAASSGLLDFTIGIDSLKLE